MKKPYTKMTEAELAAATAQLNRPITRKESRPLTPKERKQWKRVAAGKPEVLTRNGEGEIVVQSADAYQPMLEAAELSKTLAGIRRGLDQAKQGEGRSMRDFLKEFAANHGFELK
jgi:PHD/YefM family antitoxin component YafN of YafNO toxin-antitoxin module